MVTLMLSMARLDRVIPIGLEFVPAPGSLPGFLSDSLAHSAGATPCAVVALFGRAALQFYAPHAGKVVSIAWPWSQSTMRRQSG